MSIEVPGLNLSITKVWMRQIMVNQRVLQMAKVLRFLGKTAASFHNQYINLCLGPLANTFCASCMSRSNDHPCIREQAQKDMPLWGWRSTLSRCLNGNITLCNIRHLQSSDALVSSSSIGSPRSHPTMPETFAKKRKRLKFSKSWSGHV